MTIQQYLDLIHKQVLLGNATEHTFRGVWYTPQPVVQFIVRAVDDLLKSEFNLPKGLVDNTKIKVKVLQQGKKVEKELHRVQILAPPNYTNFHQ
jgi:hypothetical protein